MGTGAAARLVLFSQQQSSVDVLELRQAVLGHQKLRGAGSRQQIHQPLEIQRPHGLPVPATIAILR
jgi:hypothetical protein